MFVVCCVYVRSYEYCCRVPETDGEAVSSCARHAFVCVFDMTLFIS